MNKSLKFLLVFCALFFNAQANATGRQSDRITPGSPVSSADNALQHNKQLLPYLPSDIKGVWGDGIYCDVNGNKQDTRIVGGGRCLKYRRASENSRWIIRYSRNDGSRIFKVKNNQLLLWAAFDPNNVHVTTYTHPDATKRHAGNTRNNNSEVAQFSDATSNEVVQVQQHAKENCAGKNFFEKAACELKNAGVENAVGTVINNSR